MTQEGANLLKASTIYLYLEEMSHSVIPPTSIECKPCSGWIPNNPINVITGCNLRHGSITGIVEHCLVGICVVLENQLIPPGDSKAPSHYPPLFRPSNVEYQYRSRALKRTQYLARFYSS